MTDKQTPRSDDVPTGEEEGQLQEEMHHGIETITEMADYGLTEEQKIALGIERMPNLTPVEDEEPETPAKPERLSEQ